MEMDNRMIPNPPHMVPPNRPMPNVEYPSRPMMPNKEFPMHMPRESIDHYMYRYHFHKDRFRYYEDKCLRNRHHRRKYREYYRRMMHHRDRSHYYREKCYPMHRESSREASSSGCRCHCDSSSG